jgi:hypothetical protein
LKIRTKIFQLKLECTKGGISWIFFQSSRRASRPSRVRLMQGLLVDLIANEMRVYKREAATALDQK